MSLSLCILASGSSGNCSVVRADGGGSSGVILIDAGLSPRQTAKRLDGTGVTLDHVAGICLTHLDWDHFNRGWVRQILKRGIRVYCGPRHRDALLEQAGDEIGPYLHEIDGRGFEPVPGLAVEAIDLRHDEAGSHGFVVECGAARLAYATDLGRVPPTLVDRFAGADLLAIESNYDVRMQLESARPQFLKNRIMGGRGHLSNAEALDAVRRIFDRSHALHGRWPSHVVLLHRSRECNCPRLLRRLFCGDRRLADRLVLAEQHARTEWLSPTERPKFVGEQLTLQFGSGVLSVERGLSSVDC